MKVCMAGALPLAILLLACNSLKKNWDTAVSQGTEQSYKMFLDQHPNSPHSDEAKKRLANLNEESDWIAAANQASERAFRGFLERHPGGHHAEEAKRRAAALHPCRAAGGGDVTPANNLGRLTRETGFPGVDKLTGVIIDCRAGPIDLIVHVNKTTSFAKRPNGGARIGWSYIQPIDADDMTMKVGKEKVGLPRMYGGSIATRVDDNGRELATMSSGWVKRIGRFPDLGDKGKPLDWYGWPLVSSSKEITFVVASRKHYKFALIFPGSNDAVEDVVLDGTDLYCNLQSEATRLE